MEEKMRQEERIQEAQQDQPATAPTDNDSSGAVWGWILIISGLFLSALVSRLLGVIVAAIGASILKGSKKNQ